MGPTSPRQSVALWASSNTTTEATHREPQRVATGATAALTATTPYPGGGASKKIMAVASPILPPTRSAHRHDNRTKRPKAQRIAQDFDGSCIAIVVPCVAFLGSLLPPKRG